MKIRFKGQFDPLLEKYPFYLVDVGAREGYKRVLEPLKRYLKVVGFEPEEAEFRRLNQTADENIVYVKSALYDQPATVTLNLTKNEGLASIYMPNYRFLSRFPAPNTRGYALQNSLEMRADTLDNLLPGSMRTKVDFIKVDVEGGAYNVLNGASKTFDENLVIGVYVEAEFNEKYSGQPLFADVDRLLREHHYQLFDMKVCRWKRAAGLKTGGSEGQPVHGGFVYFLDVDHFFERLRPLSSEEKAGKIVKFVVFCCLYGNYDYAMELVQEARRTGDLEAPRAQALLSALEKGQSVLFRMPKLKGRGVASDLVYHAFMILLGVWLRRAGFWQPAVEL